MRFLGLLWVLAAAPPAGALSFSDLPGLDPRLSGTVVTLQGFMAPLIHVQSDFFVLTEQPVAVCPFCTNLADWPHGIVVVYLKNTQVFREASYPITVKGVLQVGPLTDKDTGMFSQVRLVNAEWN